MHPPTYEQLTTDSLKARVAVRVYRHGETDPQVIADRRELRMRRARKFLAGLLAEEPALTVDQRAQLAILLVPTVAPSAALSAGSRP